MNLKESIARVQNLGPEDREELERLVMNSPLRLWVPNPGPQTEAYLSEADELFYGGAAGGGKTHLAVGLGVTAHQRSLVIRREATQLRGFIDDLRTIVRGVCKDANAGLNKQDGQWRLPPEVGYFSGIPDQLIEFGGVPNPGDEERHQGNPHDLLVFDEATQLREYVLRYLSTWNRTTLQGQRCRTLLTSNPPTPSTGMSKRGTTGLWILKRYAPWLDPQYRSPLGLPKAKPGELRWYAVLNGVEVEWPDSVPFLHTVVNPVTGDEKEEVILPRSRTFIPALTTDNPYLMGTNYVAQLQALTEPLRSAMLYGDFSVSLSDRPLQLYPAEWVRAAQARWEKQTNLPETRRVPMTSLGADIARGGNDSTALSPRRGHFYDSIKRVPKLESRDGPSAAAAILKERRDGARVVVDANGVGASAYDHLHSNCGLKQGIDVVAYVGSKKSLAKDRSRKFGFPNKRSEVYWKFREALDHSSPYPIAIPPDEKLSQQLLTMTYREESGKLRVLPKEQVIDLLGESPDEMDALMLASTVKPDEETAILSAEVKRRQRLREAENWASAEEEDASAVDWSTNRKKVLL